MHRVLLFCLNSLLHFLLFLFLHFVCRFLQVKFALNQLNPLDKFFIFIGEHLSFTNDEFIMQLRFILIQMKLVQLFLHIFVIDLHLLVLHLDFAQLVPKFVDSLLVLHVLAMLHCQHSVHERLLVEQLVFGIQIRALEIPNSCHCLIPLPMISCLIQHQNVCLLLGIYVTSFWTRVTGQVKTVCVVVFKVFFVYILHRLILTQFNL